MLSSAECTQAIEQNRRYWLDELHGALRKRLTCNPPGQAYWRDYVRMCLGHLRRAV